LREDEKRKENKTKETMYRDVFECVRNRLIKKSLSVKLEGGRGEYGYQGESKKVEKSFAKRRFGGKGKR